MNWMEGLQAAINYIEEHLTENEALSPASIAAAAYSSEDNFRKIFHLVTGYTIGEYIRNRRLSLAGEEILLTDHRILDIAIAYGYDSAESYNFGRITTTPRYTEELPTTDSMTHITIPKRTWVCFECFGSSPVDMQNLWYKIYTEFLPFSSPRRIGQLLTIPNRHSYLFPAML